MNDFHTFFHIFHMTSGGGAMFPESRTARIHHVPILTTAQDRVGRIH